MQKLHLCIKIKVIAKNCGKFWRWTALVISHLPFSLKQYKFLLQIFYTKKKLITWNWFNEMQICCKVCFCIGFEVNFMQWNIYCHIFSCVYENIEVLRLSEFWTRNISSKQRKLTIHVYFYGIANEIILKLKRQFVKSLSVI